ncbi:MAG: hypothetical protein FJX76_08860 [Armatimonadetes bacterium]|nr:hypothetical protein [Armatimonadota bacterium]
MADETTPSPDTCPTLSPDEERVWRKMRMAGRAALAILLSLLLNDARTPAPVTLWAVIATFLALGQPACLGIRWLLRESPVALRGDGCSLPDQKASCVAWIGFGAALPASLLVTLAYLIMHRHPSEMTYYVSTLLASFAPTVVICLALMPFAAYRIHTSEAFGPRARAVIPAALLLLVYVAVGMCRFLPHPPLHSLADVVHLVVWAALPASWPQHVIAAAVAGRVLHLWFKCSGGHCHGGA